MTGRVRGDRARDDTAVGPVEQRNDLARFGVGIVDFNRSEGRRRGSSGSAVVRDVAGGDVLVVVSERALGQTSDEVARTIRTLRRHNLVVKVLSHGAPHLEDARG